MRPPPHDVLLNTQLIRRPISVSLAVCGAFGVGLFAATAAIGARLLGRAADGRREGRRDDLFLVLWLVLEVVGFYVFTPFPAVRRVLGLFVVMTVLSGRLAARTCRTARRRRVIDAVVVFGVSLGLAFYAIDFRDAEAARLAVERAAQRIGTVAPGTTVWYAGHWGLQFYADRAGMHLVAPGASRLRRGDWLLIPDPPVDRPHFALRGEQVEAVVPPIEVGDDLPFATVVTYYAGFVPLRAQRGPRYRLSLYRVRDDFTAVP